MLAAPPPVLVNWPAAKSAGPEPSSKTRRARTCQCVGDPLEPGDRGPARAVPPRQPVRAHASRVREIASRVERRARTVVVDRQRADVRRKEWIGIGDAAPDI